MWYGAIYFSGWTRCYISVGRDEEEIRGNATIIELFGLEPNGTRPFREPLNVLRQVATTLHDKVGNRPLAAVGVASFGPLSKDSILYTPFLPWDLVKISAAVRRHFRAPGLPVLLISDPAGAAIGEWCFGDYQKEAIFPSDGPPNPLVFLQVDKGLGGAAMANGGLVGRIFSPEMGHARVPVHEQDRSFGSVCRFHTGMDPSTLEPDPRGAYRPCVEGLASELALCRRLGWAGWSGDASSLPEPLPALPLPSVPYDEMGEDNVWRREAWYLTRWVANIIVNYAPERICMGGSLMEAEAGDWLLKWLPELVAKQLHNIVPGALMKRLRAEYKPQDYITRASLGEEAGILGAFALAKREVE